MKKRITMGFAVMTFSAVLSFAAGQGRPVSRGCRRPEGNG